MIKREWIVADTTARDALSVTDGDVAVGYECKVLATGNVYRAIRSGSGSTCWNVEGQITSGTWEPTFTYSGTHTGATLGDAYYIRVGGVAKWAIRITAMTYSGTGQGSTFATLPVSSSFASENDCTGTISADTSTVSTARAIAEATTDLINLRWTKSTDTNTHSVYAHGMYKIV